MNPARYLVGLLERSVSSAVLLREAARTSRRWQTYAARAGFSGVLLTVLLLGIWGAVSATRNAMVDTANLASLGRGLFVAFSVVQTLLALVLAPLLTASAITEETDERTLEMLVLTRLVPVQILTAKILSRILVLVTVVCGALPVMALVVNLGGVSTIEVLAVTVHTLTTVVVMSVLGAFFALFTRSPSLSTAAAASYAVPFFALYPGIYVIATGDPLASAHFSTFAAPVAVDASALLPPLSYAPSVLLMLWLSAPLFQQKVSSASIQKAFSEKIWRSRRWGMVLGGWIGVGIVTLPWMTPMAYMLQGAIGAQHVAHVAISVALWSYFTFGAALGTWAFLRVGMDVVDGIDAVFTGNQPLAGDRARVSATVSDHPILWREARFRAWSSTALPMLMVWGFLLLGVFQTGWWIIPGGLLALGALNTVFAIGFASWLATRSIAEERRRGTFELLLTTTLSSRDILFGKAMGALLPSAPMMALSGVLLVLGVPHLSLFTQSADGVKARAFLDGLVAFAWTLPVWLLAVAASMTLALRTPRPSSAFGVVMVGLLLAFGVPGILAHIFPDSWVSLLAGAIAPPLAGQTGLAINALSGAAILLVSAALVLRMTDKMRAWAGTWVVLLAAGLFAAQAAHAAPTPEEIEQLEKVFRLRMDARPLADGFVREGQPTTIDVRLENYGGDTAGRLVTTQTMFDASGTASRDWMRPVDLAAGTRKEVLLDVIPAGGEQVVSFEGDDGRRAVGVVKFQVLTPDDVLLAVIGRDPLGLPALVTDATEDAVPARAYRARAGAARTVRTGLVAPEAMPRHSSAWGSVDWVIWPDADPSKVSEAQLDALRGFVVDGGHLLLTVSDTWRQVSTSPLAPILPVTLDGLEDRDVPVFFAPGTGVGGRTPVAHATLSPGAWVRASAGDAPLWVGREVGTGTVHVVLADLDAAAFTGIRSTEAWRRLLTLPGPGGLATDLLASEPTLLEPLSRAYHLLPMPAYQQFASFDVQDESLGWEAHLRDRLDDIPGVAPLPLSWLVLFAASYLFVIGPLDFLVLRALGRQPMTWVTFPAWIVVFSGVSLYLTTSSKGSQAVVVRIEVLDLFPEVHTARGTTWLSLFSTGKTRVVLRSDLPDARVFPLREAGYQEDVAIAGGDGGGGLSYHAETWTLAYAHSDWTRPEDASVTVEGGRVTSHLPFALADAVVVVPTTGGTIGGYLSVGPLAAGASVPLTEAAVSAEQAAKDERLQWALGAFGPSLPRTRGAMDAEHRPVFVGLAATSTEGLSLEGMIPDQRVFTVVRQPVALDTRIDQSVLVATLRFDPSLQLSASLACDGQAGSEWVLEAGRMRSPPLPDDTCTAYVYEGTTGASVNVPLRAGVTYDCVRIDATNALACPEATP